MKTKLLFLFALLLPLIILIPNFANAIDPISAIGAAAHGTMARIDGEIAGERYNSNLSSKDQACVGYYRMIEQDSIAALAVGDKLENCSKTIGEYQIIKANATLHSPHVPELIGDLTIGAIGSIKWFKDLKIIPSSPFANTFTKEIGKKVTGDVTESATRSYIQNESVINGTKNQMIEEYTNPIKVSEKIASAGIAGIGSGLSDDFRKGLEGANKALLEYGNIKEIYNIASIVKIFIGLPYSSSEKSSNNIIDPTKQKNNSKENLDTRWDAKTLTQDSKDKNNNAIHLFNNFSKVKIIERKRGNTTYYYYELPNSSSEKSSNKENLDTRWDAKTLTQDSKDKNNNAADPLNNFPGGKIIEEKRGNTTYYYYELPNSSSEKSSNKENSGSTESTKKVINSESSNNNSKSSSSSKNDSPRSSSASSQNSSNKSTTTSSNNVTKVSSTNIQNISKAAQSGNISNLSTTDKAILASRL
jgi:hypothetical protein